IGLVLRRDLVAKALKILLLGDVGHVRGHAHALRHAIALAQSLGLGHETGGDITHRHMASLGDELACKLAPHARAAPGDDSNPAGKIFHFTLPKRHLTYLPPLRGKVARRAGWGSLNQTMIRLREPPSVASRHLPPRGGKI